MKYLLPSGLLLLISLSGCGPSICECADQLPGTSLNALEEWVEGEKLDFSETQELAKACKEKYGEMKVKAILEELKQCGE